MRPAEREDPAQDAAEGDPVRRPRRRTGGAPNQLVGVGEQRVSAEQKPDDLGEHPRSRCAMSERLWYLSSHRARDQNTDDGFVGSSALVSLSTNAFDRRSASGCVQRVTGLR